MIRPIGTVLLVLVILCGWPGRPGVAVAAAGLEPLDQAVCRLIERAARAEELPVRFMTRVIWRESSFRAGAVSPAGAQGIAQFMPATAEQHGLADPFDPEQAIPKAARLLAELRHRFGTLGMAAAAYNAGPGRVFGWLHGEADLPAATRAYVRFVTQDGDDGTSGSGSSLPAAAASPVSCLAVAAELRRDRGVNGSGADLGFAPMAPWGVQLAGNFSKALALAAFERERQRYAGIIGAAQPMIIGRLLRSRGTRPFYQVRLPAASRGEATMLCRRIQSAGGPCIALPS